MTRIRNMVSWNLSALSAKSAVNLFWFVALASILTAPAAATEPTTKEGVALRDALLREAEQPVKSTWRPMLRFLAELHGRSVLPPVAHFKYAYESIGPGYQDGRVFGHI